MQIPTSEEGWLEVAQKFEELWNFPHCVGALDGKHVVLQAPFNSGSEFFNYKHTFSIVLLGLADANYNFLYVDIGCQGRISDSGVFKNCSLYKHLQQNNLRFPKPKPLEGRQKEIPYFFVGDEAFALETYLMKVFPGIHSKGSPERIFNYRLCRARRIIENVFGISSSVFRVLRKALQLEPEKAKLIVRTVAHLHNFLRRTQESRSIYTPPGSLDQEKDGQVILGNWRNNVGNNFLQLLRHVPRKSSLAAIDIRHELKDYFVNEGKVFWQDKYA